MKKITILILLLVLIVSMKLVFGGSSDKQQVTAQKSNETSISTSNKEENTSQANQAKDTDTQTLSIDSTPQTTIEMPNK